MLQANHATSSAHLSVHTPSDERAHALAKVPQVTFVFWLIKIAATTLGETGGDAVSMSMKLGYLVATAIFAIIFLAAVTCDLQR